MDATRPPGRENEIFARAVELTSPEVRQNYIKGACGSDNELLARVQRLVRAHEASNGEELATSSMAPRLTTKHSPIPDPEAAGSTIGRYKMLQKIGEGGGGIVFMAEQQEPVRRRVALKIIKLGMDTREVVARFEAERQALAMMDHPNIAKVLDAGATEMGRPFFVMELVKGVPITKYCDDNRLPTSERLKLFAKVCHAVQHAHQKGIIHRDLKPSNILVALHDGAPVPKVIDFGIAKATQGRLTDRTVFTAIEQFIGTPAYMSPEQAEMSGLDIDTRSDIYSLGVLLYELLTGCTPFDTPALLKSGFDEMRRHLREVEPPRPSTRLGTLATDTLTTTAMHRHTDAPKLFKLINGDLDWIVMRCLEKDRTRRYETASELARDLMCYLGNEPVSARPPSKAYLFSKLVRRNRLAFVAGTAIVILLSSGISVSLWLAQKARSEALLARDALSFLVEDLLGGGGAVQQGIEIKDLTMLQALDLAEARIAARFKDRPRVELGIREAFLNAYVYFEKWERGITQCERMLELRKATLGPYQRDTLYNMHFLARCYQNAGRNTDAHALFEKTFILRKEHFGPDDPDTLRSMAWLGSAHSRAGRLAGALLLFEEALQRQKMKFGPDHPDTYSYMIILARGYRSARRLSEAIPLFEEIAQRKRAKFGAGDTETLDAMSDLVSAYGANHDFAKADAVYQTLLIARSNKDGPASLTVAKDAARFGYNLVTQGKFSEAEVVLRRTLAIRESIEPGDEGTYHNRSLLGEALIGQRKFTEAEPLLLSGYEGLKAREAKLGFTGRQGLEEALARLVQLYEVTNRPELVAKWKSQMEAVSR